MWKRGLPAVQRDKRILIGGLSHETNSFSPVWTEYEDFVFFQGSGILDECLGGVHEKGVELIPTLYAQALPGGLIRKGAYLRLRAQLLESLRENTPFDGLLLMLHGSMMVEEIGDGEDDLVTTIRDSFGVDPLISASLDLHGNIGPVLVARTNILTALRTAPHRDIVQTRRRALLLLLRALKEGLRPVCAMIRLPMVLAGEAAITDSEPAKTLYAMLETMHRLPGIMDASIMIGCAWSDSPQTSASVICVAESDPTLASRRATDLGQLVWMRRHEFGYGAGTASVEDAIRMAIQTEESPVFITDSGDNVTAGAPGDSAFMLDRLLSAGVESALVAGIWDRDSVQRCREGGEGATLRLRVGSKLNAGAAQPVEVHVRVNRVGTGIRYLPKDTTVACISVGGVSIILTDKRCAFTDPESIHSAGVDPLKQKMVVVKQGYLFPRLEDIAARHIIALSSGSASLVLESLPYRRLLRPVFPLDPSVVWLQEASRS
jgi:microcystin degradation protein MlrC